jgi:hypothetical protein
MLHDVAGVVCQASSATVFSHQSGLPLSPVLVESSSFAMLRTLYNAGYCYCSLLAILICESAPVARILKSKLAFF